MNPSPVELLAAALFLLAVLRTFFIKKLRDHSLQYPEGTFKHNLFHLLGEVEIVFDFWAGVLVLGITILKSSKEAIRHVDSVNFTQAVFCLRGDECGRYPPHHRACQPIDWRCSANPAHARHTLLLCGGPCRRPFARQFHHRTCGHHRHGLDPSRALYPWGS